MTPTIVVLEDDAERTDRMRECLRDHFDQYQAAFFVCPKALTDFLSLNQEDLDIRAMSLDHDINRADGSNSELTGMDVVSFICQNMRPSFPILVHSANDKAADKMYFALKELGFYAKLVAPYNDLVWINQLWRRSLRECLAQRGRPVDRSGFR